MSRLSFYVLRQMVGPTALFAFLLTSVILLTQSLPLLTLVINGGQSAPTFFYMMLLVLPYLLLIILPIAFFAGTLYSLSRLNNDSELVVMQAAGFSRRQLAMPVFAAAGIVMLLSYVFGLYLMPLGQRTLNDITSDIRADVGAALINEGEFKTAAKGLTIFIRSISGGGDIRGVMVHNNTNPRAPVTYLAERGLLARTPDGARLVMFDGTIQARNGQRLTTATFQRWPLDLDQFGSTNRIIFRRPNERFLNELLWPENATTVDRNRLLAEAHDRLSQPLYCIAFAFIALAAVTRGRRGRGAQALRLTLASLGAASLRIAGYGLAGLAARQPWLNILVYAIPLVGAGIAFAFLQGFDPLKYFRQTDPALLENPS